GVGRVDVEHLEGRQLVGGLEAHAVGARQVAYVDVTEEAVAPLGRRLVALGPRLLRLRPHDAGRTDRVAAHAVGAAVGEHHLLAGRVRGGGAGMVVVSGELY